MNRHVMLSSLHEESRFTLQTHYYACWLRDELGKALTVHMEADRKWE